MFATLACSRVWLFLNRVLHWSSNLRQSIGRSTIKIKVSFSAAMITVIKHCIVAVLCIFFEYTVGPADLDLLFTLQWLWYKLMSVRQNFTLKWVLCSSDSWEWQTLYSNCLAILFKVALEIYLLFLTAIDIIWLYPSRYDTVFPQN